MSTYLTGGGARPFVGRIERCMGCLKPQLLALFSPTQPQLLHPGSELLCPILLHSGTLTVPNVHQGSLLFNRKSSTATLRQESTGRHSLLHPLLPLLTSECTKPLWSLSDSSIILTYPITTLRFHSLSGS